MEKCETIMGLNIGRVALRKFKSIVMYLVFLALVVGSVTFATPELFGQIAHADAPVGTITFLKDVSGGASVASDWTFTISGGNGTAKSGDIKTYPTGIYTVTESGPAGYSRTGISGTACSVVGGVINLNVTTNGGTCNIFNTRDIGTINVFEYRDDNRNLAYDSGEVATPYFTVDLYNGSVCSGASIATKTSDDFVSNLASFSNINSGNYSVKETLPGDGSYANTNPACQNVSVAGGETKQLNFGNFKVQQVTACLYNDINGDGGLWQPGDSALSGWAVNLTGPENLSGVTDGDGCARITINIYGGYEVTEVVQTGWMQTFPSSPQIAYVDAQMTTGVQMYNFKLATISGQKFNDLDGDGIKDMGEPGIAGWTVNLDKNTDGSIDATTITDTNGDYSFTGLTAGTYRIREVDQTGWIQTTTNPAEVIITSGINETNISFGNQYDTIAPTVIASAQLYLPVGDPYTFGTWTNQGVTALLNGIDGGSGFQYSRFCIDQTNSCVPYDFGPIIFGTDGIWYLRFFGVDNAGNVSGTESREVKIDRVAPTATVAYDVTTPTNGLVVATITPSETVTGTLTNTFTSNGSFTFNFTDLAGNPGSVIATVSNIDKIAPKITLFGSPLLSLVQGQTFVDDGAEADDDSTVKVTGLVNTAAVGTYILTYNAKDEAGNIAKPVIRTVIINAVPTVVLGATTAPTTGGEALGDTDTVVPETTGGDQDTPEILGTETTNDNLSNPATVATTGNGWKILGMMWYWWLLILAGIASGWWIIAAAIRRNHQDA